MRHVVISHRCDYEFSKTLISDILPTLFVEAGFAHSAFLSRSQPCFVDISARATDFNNSLKRTIRRYVRFKLFKDGQFTKLLSNNKTFRQ